ncbi:hypothetical protein NEI07_04575 [Methylocystis sp. NLS-7]|nr:hypothetical protein [Methylocystis suflitae]
MIVAEQREEARKAIEAAHRLASKPDLLERWMQDEELRNGFPITRIKAPPAFATKDDEPLLQIADACSFAFMRYIKGAPRCDDRMAAMLGNFKHRKLRRKLNETNSMFFSWQEDIWMELEGRLLPAQYSL